jgi:hypothetical protein
MRSQDALDLEELSFEEGPDPLTGIARPDRRRYTEEDDEEQGLRFLLEHPEALSRSLRCQLQ